MEVDLPGGKTVLGFVGSHPRRENGSNPMLESPRTECQGLPEIGKRD